MPESEIVSVAINTFERGVSRDGTNQKTPKVPTQRVVFVCFFLVLFFGIVLFCSFVRLFVLNLFLSGQAVELALGSFQAAGDGNRPHASPQNLTRGRGSTGRDSRGNSQRRPPLFRAVCDCLDSASAPGSLAPSQFPPRRPGDSSAERRRSGAGEDVGNVRGVL